MPSNTAAMVRVTIRRVDPDGEPCEKCGDIPYLEARELKAAGHRIGYVCPDCAEDIAERFTGGAPV